MGELSPWHWLIVIGIAVVLFGARRLPDAARSLGRSARILRSELRGDEAPDARDGARAAEAPEPPGPAAAPAPSETTSGPSGTASAPPADRVAADEVRVAPVRRDEPVAGRADPQR